MTITYKDAGVDVEGGNRFVKKIAPFVRSTFTKSVLTDIGGFGALYDAGFKDMEEPVLVSGTDGVGTKLKIAQMMDKHDTIGIDAVAMCVNDIIVSGAKPLFFLDYISCGRLNVDKMADVVKGIAEGCLRGKCSLIGGETAEHPGVMKDDEYDIAGFSVGVVDKKKIINGENIAPGDVIIGLPSSGIHSNGYSLVRKLLLEQKKYQLSMTFAELGMTLGESLLTPTIIYVDQLMESLNTGADIKGIVHITGGGFYENIPRILPETTAVKIEKNSYPVLPVFKLLQSEGNIEEREMYTTFNMGIGMMLFAERNSANTIVNTLKKGGYSPYFIGEVVKRTEAPVILV
ncbi:MAG TPA: phosphoribosylformylglycinamidine cyclo-ligase [Spirochaetota bacterium]|nr:phosphoribosylformylglycinamidine cyclo-ligase [Spirochaetota bacterium]HPR36643.1 phosphoribosylformylglycinamidine cyclo-ligase [Spirochaetota bacterium]